MCCIRTPVTSHEQHGREMRAGADADRGVVQLAGIGLGVVDHLLDRMERRLVRHHEDFQRGADQHDRLEARDRMERRGRRQRDVGAERLGAEVQRVAVGRRRRGCRSADVAAAAGPVFHHHLLAPLLAELVGDQPPENVDRAGRRERDEDVHRPFGIVLRVRAGIARASSATNAATHALNDFSPHEFPPRIAARFSALAISMAVAPREINAAAMRQSRSGAAEQLLRRRPTSGTFRAITNSRSRKHGRVVRREKLRTEGRRSPHRHRRPARDRRVPQGRRLLRLQQHLPASGRAGLRRR